MYPHRITANNWSQCFAQHLALSLALSSPSQPEAQPRMLLILNYSLALVSFSTSACRPALVHPACPNQSLHVFPIIPFPLGLSQCPLLASDELPQ